MQLVVVNVPDLDKPVYLGLLALVSVGLTPPYMEEDDDNDDDDDDEDAATVSRGSVLFISCILLHS